MLSIEVVPVAAMVYEPLALVPVQSADKAPSAMSLSDMISSAEAKVWQQPHGTAGPSRKLAVTDSQFLRIGHMFLQLCCVGSHC